MADVFQTSSKIQPWREKEKDTTVHTIAGEIKGSQTARARASVHSSAGVTQLRFARATITDTPYNLLSLTQLASDGWRIDLQGAQLTDPRGITYNMDIEDDRT